MNNFLSLLENTYSTRIVWEKRQTWRTMGNELRSLYRWNVLVGWLVFNPTMSLFCQHNQHCNATSPWSVRFLIAHSSQFSHSFVFIHQRIIARKSLDPGFMHAARFSSPFLCHIGHKLCEWQRSVLRCYPDIESRVGNFYARSRCVWLNERELCSYAHFCHHIHKSSILSHSLYSVTIGRRTRKLPASGYTVQGSRSRRTPDVLYTWLPCVRIIHRWRWRLSKFIRDLETPVYSMPATPAAACCRAFSPTWTCMFHYPSTSACTIISWFLKKGEMVRSWRGRINAVPSQDIVRELH